MIEINLKNFKYIILFSFVFLFTFLLVKSVYAQSNPILIDGESCVENLATCSDPNKVNLINAIQNGDINVVSEFFSSSSLVTDIRREFGLEANNVCISNQATDIISVRRPASRDPDPVSAITSGTTDDEDHWRFCRPGDSPSVAPVSGPGRGWDITGCCPADYQLVTRDNILTGSLSGSEYQEDAYCARILPGLQPGDDLYPHSLFNTDIYDVRGNRIDYAALGVANPLITDGNRIDGVGNNFGKTSTYIQIETPSQSVSACGGTSHCAIVSVTSGSTPPAANSVDLSNELKVVSSELLTNTPGLSCSRCLSEGEAIAVTGDNLLVCSSRGEKGLVLETPLVANSVQATLAALRTDDTNRPVLERCLEQGGIYIAIGCVDPTPVGIITGLIRLAFGIMGGVALIQLILAGIAYQQGDEGKITEARNKVLATLAGIAVLVFSVLILRIIGVNVLDVIPLGSV